jgi:ankyrin repeat protein
MYSLAYSVRLYLQDGRTALHWASTSPGGVEIVQFLLQQNGIEVDKPDGSGWTPLHIAGKNFHAQD